MVHQDLYYQLGRLQIPWDQIDAAMKLVHERANAQHTMGARGYAELFCGSESTGRRLCYDSGTDGMDCKYWIEDIPSVHVDWEMTEEEWEELRSVLAKAVEENGKGKPYLWELYQAGKIGAISPAPCCPHRHSISGAARCECGHEWYTLRPPHGPHPCPADPEHVACR